MSINNVSDYRDHGKVKYMALAHVAPENRNQKKTIIA